MSFEQRVWQEIGITGPHLVSVLISSIVLYAMGALILHLWGQRLYANRSGPGFAVVLVLGAILGRSMLGPSSTLLGGVVAIVTLIVLEAIFGTARQAVINRASIIYANGTLDRRAVRHFHINEDAIWSKLRQSGVSSLDEVHAIILETDGSLTVLKHPVSTDLLSGIRHAHLL